MILDMFNESSLFDNIQTGNTQEENFLEGVEAIALKENEDPISACYRITMENEQNWFNIMNTIAFSELAFLESHGPEEVMYESADLKKIKDSIIAWIQKQWAKLKGVFESVIANLEKLVKTDRVLLKAYDEKVKANPGFASKSVTKEGFLTAEQVSRIKAMPNSMYAENESVCSALYSFNSYDDDAKCKAIIEKFKDKKLDRKSTKEDNKKILATPSRACTVADAYKAVKEGKQVSAVKQMFKETQNDFNKMLSTFKREKSSYTGDNATYVSQIISLKSKMVKIAISELNLTCHDCLKALNRDYNLRRAVLKKVVGEKAEEKKEDGKEKPANESADLICALI